MHYKFQPGLAVVVAVLALAACAAAPSTPKARQASIADAQSEIDKAVAVIGRMRRQPSMDALLRDAKGLLVVPDYGRTVGADGERAGIGLMVEQTSRGVWSHPAFFTVEGLNIGMQASAEAAAIAYVLITARAIAPFETRINKFSLGPDAGLKVVEFLSDTPSSANHSDADVMVWTGIKELSNGATFGATDVVADSALNEVYYRGLVSPRQILIGAVHNPQADELERALTTSVAAK